MAINDQEIKELLQNLNNKIAKQNKRMAGLEDKLAVLESSKVRQEAPPEPPAPEPPKGKIFSRGVKIADKFVHAIDAGHSFSAPDAKDAPTPPTPSPKDKVSPPSKEAKEKAIMSMEERIGGHWFAKIGIVVFILGISFLLKYAFDNNWIGPTGRVLMGVIAGIGLLFLGEMTIRKYKNYGQLVTGGGLGVLYLSIFAALNFYELIPFFSAFLFMALISGVGIALSLRYNSPALIIYAVLGGFFTPILIANGQDNQIILFSYIILLDLAVLFISIFRPWRWLNVISFLGTIMLFSYWADAFYNESLLVSTFVFLSVFFVIYTASSLVYNLAKKEKSLGIEQVLCLVNGIVYFLVTYSLLEESYHYVLGAFAMFLAIYYFLWAYLVREITPDDDYLFDFLAFLTVGFITVAIPIQFNKYFITMAWLVEAVLLFLAGVRAEGKIAETIKIFAFSVFGLSLLRVLVIDQQSYNIDSTIFVNPVFVSALLAIASAYLITWLFKTNFVDENESRFKSRSVIATLLIIASFLTVFGVSREISVYYETKVKIERNSVNQYNRQIDSQYGYRGELRQSVDRDFIKKQEERKTVFMFIFWVIYGALLLLFAVFYNNRYLLIMGTILYLVVIARVILLDLWQIESFLKIYYASIVVVLSYFGGAWLNAHKNQDEIESFWSYKRIIAMLLIGANLVTILGVSREIYSHYEKSQDKLNQEYMQCLHPANNKDFRIPYYKNCEPLREKIRKQDQKASVSMSLFWLFYAIILIIAGFWKKNKWVRLGGISLLLIAILKLFFIDLWSLGSLYRIVASISLGLVLLSISLLYQKYRYLFKEIISD